MEVLAAAQYLEVVFSDELTSDIDVIIMGDGNGWSWTQETAYEPDDGLTMRVNLPELFSRGDNWDKVTSGEGAALILGSMDDLADYLVSASLILEGGAVAPAPTPAPEVTPAATPAPTPTPQAPTATTTAAGANVLRLTLGSTNYTLNGVAGTIEVAPASIGGRTMVPLRFIGETLGAEIGWNDTTRTATFTLGSNVANVTIGQPLPNDMGTPIIEGGRTLVPVRFVSASMGAEVEWIDATRTVVITFGGNDEVVELPNLPVIDVNVNDVDDHDHDDDCDDEDCDHDDHEEETTTPPVVTTPGASGDVIFEATASAALAAELMDGEAEYLSLAGVDNGEVAVRFENGALVVYDRGKTQWPGWQGIDIMLEDLGLSAGGMYAVTVEGTGTGSQLMIEWPLDRDPWDTGRVTGSGGSVTMEISGNPAETPGKTVSPGQSVWRVRVNARGSDDVNVGDLTITAIRVEKLS
jgi:hypothetical protein